MWWRLCKDRGETVNDSRRSFSALYDKYGVDFNGTCFPLLQANGNFVEELKKEIGNDHFLYHKKFGQWQSAIQMMMCCMLPGNELGTDTYYVSFDLLSA